MIVVRPSTSLRMTSCSLALMAPDSRTLIVRGPRWATNVAMIAAGVVLGSDGLEPDDGQDDRRDEDGGADQFDGLA